MHKAYLKKTLSYWSQACQEHEKINIKYIIVLIVWEWYYNLFLV
jgi:hypothetical protein